MFVEGVKSSELRSRISVLGFFSVSVTWSESHGDKGISDHGFVDPGGRVSDSVLGPPGSSGLEKAKTMPTKAKTPEDLTEKRREKQARARARRAAEKADMVRAQAELTGALKPLEEWDSEELARGRPRNKRGDFTGPKPTWLSRAVQEESLRRFQEISREDMRVIVPKALKTVENILDNNERDRRGRPLVPMSVKLQAAQWVVEHLVGKPTQRVEADISVKLQGILANCLVVPGQGNVPAIDVQSWDPEDEPDDAD